MHVVNMLISSIKGSLTGVMTVSLIMLIDLHTVVKYSYV